MADDSRTEGDRRVAELLRVDEVALERGDDDEVHRNERAGDERHDGEREPDEERTRPHRSRKR